MRIMDAPEIAFYMPVAYGTFQSRSAFFTESLGRTLTVTVHDRQLQTPGESLGRLILAAWSWSFHFLKSILLQQF